MNAILLAVALACSAQLYDLPYPYGVVQYPPTYGHNVWVPPIVSYRTYAVYRGHYPHHYVPKHYSPKSIKPVKRKKP